MSISYPHHSGQSSLADAKTQLNIHGLWRHFGFDGEPKTSCRCPWREDRKPSFSVNVAGTLWNDFATGEAGDTVDFFQRASGLSKKDACLKFIELAGGGIAPAQCPARPHRAGAKPKPVFPDFTKGTEEAFKQLASLRRVSPESVELASQRGLLLFATLKDCPAWIVTDPARLNAHARRMDGQIWKHVGAKAWTLPGGWASWPIGIMEARPFSVIALCEGGPDLLAACHFIVCESRERHCSPVAMLGATQRIHPDALPLFAGKRIRIFGHADDEGRKAVERWTRQLETAGADCDAFNFAGLRQADESAVKDLNDLTFIHPDDFETERTLWNLLP
ncbi:MAG: CHC2 zinc finger domain-containing protein [Limisphaerales bacterium]